MRTYVGRAAELDRVAQWLDREVLFLIYGVAGIGKSEFAFKAIEDARARAADAPWSQTEPVLLRVREGTSMALVLAQLRVAADERAGGDHAMAPAGRIEDELAEIARALDRAPSLVFIDDVHHLDPAEVASALAYLSRHVRASRLFVASRLEVPLPPGAPPPVVTRLSPLRAEDTAAMVAELADRLGTPAPDPDDVFRRSGGSPFYVQRLLAPGTPSRGAAGTDGDARAPRRPRAQTHGPAAELEESLADLSERARDLLLGFAVLRGRFAVADLVDAEAAGPDVQAVVGELSRRFLVDVSRDAVMVHDLIREFAIRLASDGEMMAAHRLAADLHEHRYYRDPRGQALDAVEALYHLCDAGEYDRGWALAEASYRAIAAAGLDHLLAEPLRVLRRELEDHADAANAIDLVRGRIGVRRSLIAEADELLAAVAARGGGDSPRYLILAGEVAQRRGDLGRAEELFERAHAQARGQARRFRTALQLADVQSLRGAGERARSVLDDALAQHPDLPTRDRARWSWSLALSYVLEERFEEGARIAAEAGVAAREAGARDLVVLLCMLEVVSRCEVGEIREARQVWEELRSRARDGALREHVLSLYDGVLTQAEGELRGARVALESSFAYLLEHRDAVMATIAGYYLSKTLLAQGEAVAACEMAARMCATAASAGLDMLVSTGKAVQASASLAAARTADALALARSVLEAERARPIPRSNSRWLAQVTLARCLAYEGDLDGARRELAAAGEALAPGQRKRYAFEGELERAIIELTGGDSMIAATAAEAALHGFAARGSRWYEARAAVTLAAALVGCGEQADLAAAETALARAEELAAAHGYSRVAAWGEMVRGAMLIRAGDERRGRAHLLAAIRSRGSTSDRLELAVVNAALHGDGAGFAPGVRAMAAMFGLAQPARSQLRYQFIDRGERRQGSEDDVARARARRELVVEPDRAVITAGGGAETDQGRPMACQLLARLIEGQGAPVTAEELFRDVWGGREFHPLRHRNTVYVAVKRLRQAVRRLLGDREVIETATNGWRIADGIDAVSIRLVTD